MKALNDVTSAVKKKIKKCVTRSNVFIFFSSVKYVTVKTGQYLVAEGYILFSVFDLTHPSLFEVAVFSRCVCPLL